jgi:hypothetical protein
LRIGVSYKHARTFSGAARGNDLVDSSRGVAQREIAKGMHKKPIDAFAREFKYDPLLDEVRMVVIAGSSRGGLLSFPAIDKMVPRRTGDAGSGANNVVITGK